MKISKAGLCKSRSDGTLLTVSATYGNSKVSQVLYRPCGTVWSCVLLRRLKSAVNKVPSLRDLFGTLKLFKTKTDLLNEINVYFDFFSVVDRPERPLRLIKYDTDKKIIYIPIVFEKGKVTDRYILYQFNGQYFEHI